MPPPVSLGSVSPAISVVWSHAAVCDISAAVLTLALLRQVYSAESDVVGGTAAGREAEGSVVAGAAIFGGTACS